MDTGRVERDERLLIVLAGATLLFFALTARGYGYFRDELYYLANAEHLGFGYVDHPPMIGAIAALTRALLGDSIFAIRFPAALAAAATVYVAGAIAAELGGRRFAQALAALCVLATPVFLALFSFLSMNAFDVLLWAVAWWVVARILRTGREPLWLVFGVIAGLGLQTKISMLFLGLSIPVGLAVARRWEHLRSRWLWIGGAIAAAIFAPYVAWQAAHGWPLLDFMENARLHKNVQLSFPQFMTAQVKDMTGPVLAIVWACGITWLLAARAAATFRALGWACVAVVAVMVGAGGAKPYYLAPAYSMLFGAGAVAIEQWGGRRKALRVAALVAVLAGGAIAAPMAKPLLSEDAYVRYASALGLTLEAGERHALGRLPQHFADMHGWPELAATVARVYHSLPSDERTRACIFGQNYGEAGAIDFFGPPLGLPKAISAHNSYFLWGPRGCTGEVLIVIGDDRETLETIFARVDQAATFTCTDCMPYENNLPIWVVREPRIPLARLWPSIRNYG